MYKLQKFMCHYNTRKYSLCARVVNIWNSLPNEVVEADTVNVFKYRLDKHWCNQELVSSSLMSLFSTNTAISETRSNQDVLFDFDANLAGTDSVPICM